MEVRTYDTADGKDPAYMTVAGKVSYDIAVGVRASASASLATACHAPCPHFVLPASIQNQGDDPAYMTVRGRAAYDNPTIAKGSDHGYMEPSAARGTGEDPTYMTVTKAGKKVIAVKPLNDEPDSEYLDIAGTSDL
jgi:hypothetical protein